MGTSIRERTEIIEEKEAKTLPYCYLLDIANMREEWRLYQIKEACNISLKQVFLLQGWKATFIKS